MIDLVDENVWDSRKAYAAYVKATVDEHEQPVSFEKWHKALRAWNKPGLMTHEWVKFYSMVE